MFALFLENLLKVKLEQGPFASKIDAAQAALATATEKYEEYLSRELFDDICGEARKKAEPLAGDMDLYTEGLFSITVRCV